MRDPLVSVVITSYNNEAYIGEAVRSVLDQTMRDLELIIVDDASTDHSLDVIRSFQDDRIRVLVNERNSQISVARNRGFAAAKGKYLAALDSDDAWMPDKLEKQVSWMESSPRTGVCFTWLELMDGRGNRIRQEDMENLYRVENRSREQWLHDLLLNGNCLADDSSLISRGTMERIEGCRPGLVQLQDLDRWIRVVLEDEIHVIQEPLLRYRRAGDGASISAQKPETFHRHYLEAAWIIGNTIRGMDPSLFRKAFRKEMKHPEAEAPEEIEMEKALLLCSDLFQNDGVKLYGFEMMEQLLRNGETARQLREKYDYTQHQLYRMSGNPIFFDPLCRLEEEKLRSRVTELEDKVRLMEGSRWWKLGKQIRRLKNRDK